MFRFFQFSIPSLLTAVEQIIQQLQQRAAEKQVSANGKYEKARSIMDDADRDRQEARLATSMADKLTKLTK